jgi:GDP-L-fucose synthase
VYKNKKVLVTGGTGMIGIQLVRLLLDQGANVRVASLDPTPSDNQIEFLRGNLVDWDFCQKIVSGMDYVFQLAGIKGSVGIGTMKAASFFVPHILMNTMMMEAARKADVQRYLYTSSVGVYHPAALFVEDEAWDGPPHHTDRFAGWAKRMGELQAEAYKTEYGWDKIAIVRPSNVYGPKDNFDPETAMVIPALINRVSGGENPLVVWGDGSAIRDFIYSKDVAEGMLLAMEHGANCTPVNLGSGEGVSIREIVESILGCFDEPPEIKWDTSKPSGEPVRLVDMTRAKEMLGFSPRTSIGDGIAATVEWYKQNSASAKDRYNVFHQKDYMAT